VAPSDTPDVAELEKMTDKPSFGEKI